MEVKYHLKYQYDSLVTKTDNEPGVQTTKRVIESSIFVEFLTSSRESGDSSVCWLAVMRSRYSDYAHVLHSLEQGMKPVLGHTGDR